MIMSSVNRESFTTSFLNYISSISSSCLMSLAKTSRFILYGIRSGVLVWLWILVEMLTAFPIQHDAGNVFHTLPRLCWGMFLLYQVCSSFFFFYHEGMLLNLSNAFSASIEIIMWFLVLSLLMLCITFGDLCMLNYPCISGMIPSPGKCCFVFWFN